MATYKMNDGTIVKTENASATYTEADDWDGSNRISRNTGSQWAHQDLYRSRKGRYYIVHSSQYQGSIPWAEWISPEQAAVWLLHNDCDLPAELSAAATRIEE